VDEGYPEVVRGGGGITGLDTLEGRDDIHVFHAGTAWRDGAWRVRGGRAAYGVARGSDRAGARDAAYAAVETLTGEGWRCRRDIASGAPTEVAST